MMIIRILAISAVISLLSACAHIPKKLQVSEGTQLTNFEQAKGNELKGTLARWGGVIAKVTNQEKNTVIEVVHFGLKSSTRPLVKDDTNGRFKVIYPGLLDPVIYKEGRSITAIGKVGDLVMGKIGEHEYEYPTLIADHVHLWKEIKEVDLRVEHYPHWYMPSLWYYPNPYYYRPVYRKANVSNKKSSSTTSK